MEWKQGFVANNMLREILGRAEPFFRKDKMEQQKLDQHRRMRPLEEQVKELEQRMESGDSSQELMETYELVRGQLYDLRMERDKDNVPVSPEWAILMSAIGKLPPIVEGPKTPNLRLIVDAMDRLKAEGAWDEDLGQEDGTSLAAK